METRSVPTEWKVPTKVGNYVVNADINRLLGKTPKCMVFEGQHASSGDEVAAKMFTWGKGYSTEEVDKEVELMKSLPCHDNVLKLLDYIKKDVDDENLQLWLILEKCAMGDLETFAKGIRLDACQKLDLFLQTAKGLNHIHQHGFVHRDVKMKNILVRGSPIRPVIKVADFGESRIMEHDVTDITATGTRNFMAPELCQGEAYARAGKAVDTFSLGVTFLPVFFIEDGSKISTLKVMKDGSLGTDVRGVPLGEYLLKNPNTDVSALITKPSDSAEVRLIKELIAAMLAPRPEQRPSMQQVVEQLTKIVVQRLEGIAAARTEELTCLNLSHKKTLAELKDANSTVRTLRARCENLQSENARLQQLHEDHELSKNLDAKWAKTLEVESTKLRQEISELRSKLSEQESFSGSMRKVNRENQLLRDEMFSTIHKMKDMDEKFKTQFDAKKHTTDQEAQLQQYDILRKEKNFTGGDAVRSLTRKVGGRRRPRLLDETVDHAPAGKSGKESPWSLKSSANDPITKSGLKPDPDAAQDKEDCPICLVAIADLKCLDKRGHKFCNSCIQKSFQHKPVYPICWVLYGNQPTNGTMNHHVRKHDHPPGYPACGMIVIDYSFPSGRQGPEHPSPGESYSGTAWRAYLPDNHKGHEVLGLLKQAFKQRLVFTIGRCVTSGQENTVIWSDIQHKTSIYGGPRSYGYPDPTYLDKVTHELASKGITSYDAVHQPKTLSLFGLYNQTTCID